ncbi:hypothetical protein TNCV_2377491 [Trichonephila clavipes]|nr:hypothetical protein TNCV_2377491 [Trichonephila clavipes]
MASNKPQKAFYAMEYAKAMSVITVQCNFRRQFGVDPPTRTQLNCKRNVQIGRMSLTDDSSRRPSLKDDAVRLIDEMKTSFFRSKNNHLNQGWALSRLRSDSWPSTHFGVTAFAKT